MKVHPDFDIYFSASEEKQLIDAINAVVKPPFTPSLDEKNGVAEEGEFWFFDYSGKPSSEVYLSRVKPGHIQIVNIVPKDDMPTYEDEYAKILAEFDDQISDAVGRCGGVISRGTVEQKLGDFLSEELIRLLKNACISRWYLRRHELDSERWMDFLAKYYLHKNNLDGEALRSLAAEEEWWPANEEHRTVIARDILFAKELLKRYDEIRVDDSE